MEIEVHKISQKTYKVTIHVGEISIRLGYLDMDERTALANVFMSAADELIEELTDVEDKDNGAT